MKDARPRVQRLDVPEGTPVLLGPPAAPMPAETAEAIARAVTKLDDVLEAHLPQCFVLNMMERPAQVLFLIVEPGAEGEPMTRAIDRALRPVDLEGGHLDIWIAHPGDSWHQQLQRLSCQLVRAADDYPEEAPPWWKFWA